MADVIPTIIDEHVAIVKATAPKYFKGLSDLTFRRRLWLAMLLRYGRIEYNGSSHSCVWNVEYSQPDVSQYADAGDLDFEQHDAQLQLTVGVRGYRATDRLTEKQRLMNMGSTAITNEYREKSKRLTKSIRQKLCAELYIDGNASNNGNRFLGIESFMGNDGNTVAADKVAAPSDTYAGQSTAPQNDGGTWSTDLSTSPNAQLATDWPLGQGSSEYDWLSPLLVNASSSAWNTGATTWQDNCESVMRFARVTQESRGAMDDNQSVPFMHMLSPDFYIDFLDFYAARNRQVVPHREADNLGFGNTMNFEGSMVHYESDTPASVGYGIAPNQMDMFVLHGQLIEPWGPERSISKMGYLYLAYVFGNLRFQPKFFSRYALYA